MLWGDKILKFYNFVLYNCSLLINSSNISHSPKNDSIHLPSSKRSDVELLVEQWKTRVNAIFKNGRLQYTPEDLLKDEELLYFYFLFWIGEELIKKGAISCLNFGANLWEDGKAQNHPAYIRACDYFRDFCLAVRESLPDILDPEAGES